jgi:hypothetical protein
LRRYFFHLVKRDETVPDTRGSRHADLGSVVSEAERIAIKAIRADRVSPREWSEWKIDVQDDDGTRLFFFPFEEIDLQEKTESGSFSAPPARGRRAGLGENGSA